MPMKETASLTAGLIVLAMAWSGPLAIVGQPGFSFQMLTHMLVVAVASPLLAVFLRPVLQARASPIVIATIAFVSSLADFILIWAWHVPVLHDYARYNSVVLLAEQASFLFIGVVVWTFALATYQTARRTAGLVGAGVLFFTSMHMTLLGALLALASRPLYGSCLDGAKALNLSVQEDQQLGGVIMLVMGGLIYLGVGLALAGASIGAHDDLSLRKKEGS
jgi:putative membrane protein